MDKLPHELIHEILEHCAVSCAKNDLTPLRLVCKAFDRVLKPMVCATIGLDFTRLSKRSVRPAPQVDALQTIGYRCKNIYIDMMVMRDDTEVEFLESIYSQAPALAGWCQSLRDNYGMSPLCFTSTEYYDKLEEIFFNCRGIEALRLNLPFQIVGGQTNAATMVLANTFKALAMRPPEDSAPLRTMVMDNATDISFCRLWLNPTDVKNFMTMAASLKNLVITLRRQDQDQARSRFFSSCFWSMVMAAAELESLGLIGLDMQEGHSDTVFRRTFSDQVSLATWFTKCLPDPIGPIPSLTRLELKRVEIHYNFLPRVAEHCKALEELYLNQVSLRTEGRQLHEGRHCDYLWIGIPNARPPRNSRWIAMELRVKARRLRICRASSLVYNHFTFGQANNFNDDYYRDLPEFDLNDPAGLRRPIARRFVEVVMGIEQPNTPQNGPLRYLPRNSAADALVSILKPRGDMRITQYDTNAYQRVIGNNTSIWQITIDGVFQNHNQITLSELYRIALKASAGLDQMRLSQQNRRDPNDPQVRLQQEQGQAAVTQMEQNFSLANASQYLPPCRHHNHMLPPYYGPAPAQAQNQGQARSQTQAEDHGDEEGEN